jgi:hypothetical protein
MSTMVRPKTLFQTILVIPAVKIIFHSEIAHEVPLPFLILTLQLFYSDSRIKLFIQLVVRAGGVVRFGGGGGRGKRPVISL